MLLAVDKPKGITSFDCIRALKKKFPKQKIGHSGTLDPMASGLMLVGVGAGTKLLNELQGLSKQYKTTIDFSKKSDTRDLDYWEYFEQLDLSKLQKKSISEIQKTLDLLVPEYNLPLSGFSAKKKDGKKLYELARKGEFEMEYRTMKVNGYKLLEYDFPKLNIKLDVGSGTYIRSIGYWLGQEKLGLGGILTELKRLSIGNYQLDKYSFEDEGIWWKDDTEYKIKYTEISYLG